MRYNQFLLSKCLVSVFVLEMVYVSNEGNVIRRQNDHGLIIDYYADLNVNVSYFSNWLIIKMGIFLVLIRHTEWNFSNYGYLCFLRFLGAHLLLLIVLYCF